MNTVLVLIIINMVGHTTYNTYHFNSEEKCRFAERNLQVKEKVLYRDCINEGEKY